MKKFNTVVDEVVKRINNFKSLNNNKISTNEISKIIDTVCVEMDFKGNEFAICYTLGIA